ncbi:MAG: sodium:solute symporter family protein [Pseudomonadota bacterium]
MLYLIVTLGIGIFSGRSIRNFSHFAVGHRNFTAFIIFCTLSASYIGGGYTIGNAAKVYSHGMIYAFALLGFSLKEILVGTLIAPRMKHYQDCLSVGDMIAKTYGNSPQIFTGIFAVLICAGILGAQINALSTIFHTFFPEINTLIGVLISFFIIIIYCTLGGMKAVVYTDVFQFLILAVGIPILFISGLHKVGGWSTINTSVPTGFLFPFGSAHQIWVLLGLFIAFMFGEILVPPYVQRLFMTNPKSTCRGTVASGILSIPVFIITGLIGLIAYTNNHTLNSNLALPYVIMNLAPPVLKGFLIAALIAIIMSSAAGFLNAAAISFINDIMQPICRSKIFDLNFSQLALLRITKITTFLVGVLAVFFAMGLKNALDILLFSYNLWSPIVLVPLVAAIFGIAGRGAFHYFISALGGFAGAMLWRGFIANVAYLNSATFGILVNLLLFIIMYNFLRPMPKKRVNSNCL